ncbi:MULTISPECIES: hypothetical protein [unclassified Rhizobium]|uniref:hypothetical protein n=1 Tax=unclassified Rhizobium TaxID=2613769 RepID=UPI001A9A15A7|nr:MULTISPECIES: hypothetical protein [unclassified Rhizobium]MBX5168000.1 hypothetical protein [Rhizobium sp. NZLR4b]MBX5187093.1 hypothetical protein [Rhizobium sp. NZLR5]MBX5193410.1 hypothetical protein [Rhizobium sp. NZLR3b]MBX5199572.1 hypothetical protein [Rhizobium sp. NZLR10]MBX5205925.1 hypothetical protein [Rhizobium sp. NZLR1]
MFVAETAADNLQPDGQREGRKLRQHIEGTGHVETLEAAIGKRRDMHIVFVNK